MDKTIGNLTKYMKEIIPKSIPESYAIDPMFRSISDDESIRAGVLSFREFLYQFCDCVIADEDISQITKKGKEKFSDETTLTVEFPFLNNIKSLLLNVGEHGILSENGDAILVGSWDKFTAKRSYNKNSTAKISNAQVIKCMRLLSQCGILFDGIDLSVKKPDISAVDALQISYPNDPTMLIGWKALSLAQDKLSCRKNEDILLRCDYMSIKEGDLDIELIMKDFIEPLSPQLQEFILGFHKHFVDAGMRCDVDYMGFCTHFIYYHKKKAIWRFTLSFHNGYRMIIKTKNTSRYVEVIDKFPLDLQEKILKGYGCDRKSGTGHGNCQKGCEGFRFPLDDSLLDISEELKVWLDSEINSMQRKKKSKKLQNKS